MIKVGSRTCFIVAIEGADRLGKATQTEILLNNLRRSNIRATHEEVPWKDNITYDLIYKMLNNGDAVEHPVVFQTYQGCNRLIMQTQYLQGLAMHFDVILLDRWTPSTWVYGRVSGVTDDQTETILQDVWDPDFTVILDGKSFDMPDKRADDYEKSVAFQESIREGYLQWFETHQENAAIVNANRDRHTVSSDIAEVVLRFLTDVRA